MYELLEKSRFKNKTVNIIKYTYYIKNEYRTNV